MRLGGLDEAVRRAAASRRLSLRMVGSEEVRAMVGAMEVTFEVLRRNKHLGMRAFRGGEGDG